MSVLIVDRCDERLTHFTCADPRCMQCWSIPDFDGRIRWPSRYVFCPRCGRPQKLDAGFDEVLAA